MAGASTDLVRKKKSNFSTTLSSGINDSVATIPISSSSGLPSTTAITLTIDRVDANGVSTPTLMERVTGVVGTNQLTTATRGVEGTAQAHSAGAVVEDIWEAATWNDLCTAFLVGHSQAGHIKTGMEIDDTSADHQYVLAVSELAADRTVTMPLLLSADTFAFTDMIQTFINKTLTSPTINTPAINSGTITTPTIILPTVNSGHILQMVQSADAPASPAANYMKMYFKSDKKLYKKDSAGTETEVGAAASTDGWNAYSAVTPTCLSATFDDPTYPLVFAGVDLTTTLYPGMRVKITQSTVKYGIITAVAFSTNTTVTVYMGTDYDMADTSATAVTAFSYSSSKAPAGFPMSPAKWMVEVLDSSDRTQASPVASTWYNLNSTVISVPIGVWSLEYHVNVYCLRASTGIVDMQTTVSTANNSESDSTMTGFVRNQSTSAGTIDIAATLTRHRILTVAAKTTLYMNARTNQSGVSNIYFSNVNGQMSIRAICAYL